jgi:plastocyanin
LNEASKVIWAGFALAVLSGTGVLLNQYFSIGEITYWDSAYFQAKLILSGVILGNGVVFHRKVLPFMRNHLGEDMREEEFCREYGLFSLTGAVSIISWWSVVVLAVLSPSLTLSLILNIYALVVSVAALSAYLVVSQVLLGHRGSGLLVEIKDLGRPFKDLRGEKGIPGFPDRRFVLGLSSLFLVLLVSAGAQFTLLCSQSGELSVEDADERVLVGEMYFNQVGIEENNTVEVDVEDLVVFENEGSIAHTVTIPALGVDRTVEPGEEVIVRIDEQVEERVLNCTYHSSHRQY